MRAWTGHNQRMGTVGFSAQTWNADRYAADGRFVGDLAGAIVAMLAPRAAERILDAGCGDGALTAQLAAMGAHVTGVDVSPAMVAAARARAEGAFDVVEASLTALPFDREFDAVFSNAALHWIPAAHQPRLLASLFAALRPGGRLVAEMGAQGNIAAIRVALDAVLAPLGLDAEALAASFFPSSARYRAMLEAAGFQVETVSLHPRPTPLPGGAEGMRRWLETFRNGVLDHVPPGQREAACERVIALLAPRLQDGLGGDWTADYVRLRLVAHRPA